MRGLLAQITVYFFAQIAENAILYTMMPQ